MLYVVSGFMRTGTSMMMRALEAGGLEACYQQSRDQMKDRFADEYYDPNIGGLYELERHDYRHPEFPRQFEGKLIKALNKGIITMNVMQGGIRVVFMRRDKEEIRQSYEAFFNRHLNSVDNLDSQMERIIEQIKNRKDVVSIHTLWYRDVVDNPLRAFQCLETDGWPIDPQKAAGVVDPKYCRFRYENLTVGVL